MTLECVQIRDFQSLAQISVALNAAFFSLSALRVAVFAREEKATAETMHAALRLATRPNPVVKNEAAVGGPSFSDQAINIKGRLDSLRNITERVDVITKYLCLMGFFLSFSLLLLTSFEGNRPTSLIFLAFLFISISGFVAALIYNSFMGPLIAQRVTKDRRRLEAEILETASGMGDWN